MVRSTSPINQKGSQAANSRRTPRNRLTRQPHAALRRSLSDRLAFMSYPRFQQLAIDLMSAMGYSDVHALGRKRFYGTNRHGGAEIAAYAGPDCARLLVIAQVKRYKLGEAVPKRFVDQLRGAMLRVGARQGLLITTGTFNEVAGKAAYPMPAQALCPLRLMDGEHLATLMIRYKVGVYAPPGDGRCRLDAEYFSRLDLSADDGLKPRQSMRNML